MGEINEQKSEKVIVPEKSGIERGKVGYKNPPKEYQFKKGEVRNPYGRGKGIKNFDTIFEEAIREIAKTKDLKIDNPERKLMVRAVIEALKGNHNFWKSLAEFRYGKAKESIDLTSDGEQLGIIILPIKRKQELNESKE